MGTSEAPILQPRRRLARRLAVILVLLALLQMLAAGIPFLAISYSNQRRIIASAQQQAAERMALAIDFELEHALVLLHSFVENHDPAELMAADPEELSQWLDVLLGHGELLEVWLLDSTGQEVFQHSTHRYIHYSSYASRAERPEYQAIASGASQYISAIHIREDISLSIFPVTTLAVPISLPDGGTAVLIAEMDTRTIQAVIAEAPLGEQAYAYIVDRDGILRVHWSNERITLEQRDLSAVPVVQAFLSGQEGSLRYDGINDQRGGMVVGTWAPLQEADWGVIVEQPVSEAFRGLWQMMIWLGVLLIVSVVAAAGAGTLLARRFLRPLEVLQEGARQLSEGNLAHRIDLPTGDETEVLAGTFNLMAERVQSSHEAIEAQVQARTQELAQAYEELQRQSEEQGRLLQTIRSMSTPVIPVLEGIVVMPLIGSIDSERAGLVTEALLAGIEEHRARAAILDITGVSVVDTAVANALLQAMQAALLLGVRPVLVGITPEVAQTMVHLGVDMSSIITRSTLQSGVEYASAWMGRSQRRR